LAHRFAALVATLLLATAMTFGAGALGLRSLNRSLDAVVTVDMQRLMTITDLRRGIRSLGVLERDALLEPDATKAQRVIDEVAAARAKLAPSWEKYERFLAPGDAAAWKALRADFAASSALTDRVLDLLVAGRASDAKTLAQTHGKRWESLIKDLIEDADRRLKAKAAETHATYTWARRTAWMAFLGACLLGLAAGFLVYRGIKRMLQEILTLKDHLLAANEGLEKTVEERTRTIRAILDHVRFGFFLVGRDLCVTDGYTRSTLSLLGQQNLAGMSVSAALGLSPRDRAHFEACMSQVFEDILPEELSCDQIPSRFERNGCVLRLQVSVVRDAQGQVAQMLFGISDVTSLEHAERANRESQTLLAALKNPEPFHNFVADVTERFGSIREAMTRADHGRVRRELHTIKGSASCFGLADLAKRAHQVEDLSPIPMDPLLDLEREFERFLTTHFDLLGIGTQGNTRDSRVRVDGAALASLVRLVEDEDVVAATTDPASFRDKARALLLDLRTRPLQDLLGPMPRQIEELAQRLGKDLRFRVVGGEVKVLPERVAPLLSVLPHAFRNAVDHGIEGRGERDGKEACATIELRFELLPGRLRVTVSDDGRGINLAKLRARAVERGLIAADAELSEPELCQLVFAPRLSTADEVGETSGRGEGMGAIAEAVTKAGGNLEIQSTAGAGTRLVIDWCLDGRPSHAKPSPGLPHPAEPEPSKARLPLA
jgi:HPt (histidine-containing phosphotransfer) domain-containing protein